MQKVKNSRRKGDKSSEKERGEKSKATNEEKFINSAFYKQEHLVDNAEKRSVLWSICAIKLNWSEENQRMNKAEKARKREQKKKIEWTIRTYTIALISLVI